MPHNQDFVIGSLMRNNLEKLSPTKPPAPSVPRLASVVTATMPRHRPPPAPVGTAAAAEEDHHHHHRGPLNRTNSVGRLVSNFEQADTQYSSGRSGGGFNAATNRFLLERQRSSPNLPNTLENGHVPGRITKPTWKPPVPSALSKPPLKTRFRLGDGDVEIDPSSAPSSAPPGWNRDFRGPTSLAKPPVPAAASKPTLRHTVRSAAALTPPHPPDGQ